MSECKGCGAVPTVPVRIMALDRNTYAVPLCRHCQHIYRRIQAAVQAQMSARIREEHPEWQRKGQP